MDLRHLTDDTLLKDTYSLAQKEREITSKLLYHLKEIDRRKLFSDLRCTSLFDYCTRILGYSDGSAHRRISSARLLDELPELENKIETGSLNLMNIASAATFFKQESITDSDVKRDVLKQLENLTKNDCEKKLMQLSGKEIPSREDKKRISYDKLKVTMVLSDETMEKLNTVQGLLARRKSNEDLLNYMADIVIKKLEKQKFKLLS